MSKNHEKIRERAYEIWDREGRQEGRAEDHWRQAEREIAATATDAAAGLTQAAGPSQEPAAAPQAAKAKKTANGVAPAAKAAASAQRKKRGSPSVGQA